MQKMSMIGTDARHRFLSFSRLLAPLSRRAEGVKQAMGMVTAPLSTMSPSPGSTMNQPQPSPEAQMMGAAPPTGPQAGNPAGAGSCRERREPCCFSSGWRGGTNVGSLLGRYVSRGRGAVNFPPPPTGPVSPVPGRPAVRYTATTPAQNDAGANRGREGQPAQKHAARLGLPVGPHGNGKVVSTAPLSTMPPSPGSTRNQPPPARRVVSQRADRICHFTGR
jgi:hypothetical protein